MVEHDVHGRRSSSKLVDDLGIANDTIVFYSTDNGPHYNAWPDAGTTPFRSEKNSNWEGAYRVPAFVRWPGHFPAGTTLNGLVAHEDWMPTFLAAAGMPDVKERLMKGDTFAGRKYRAHPDGYNMLDYLSGKTKKSPRNEFWYVNDDGQDRRRPLAGLEGRLPGKPRRGVRRVARAVRRTAGAVAVQPAPRSVRESRSTTRTPTTTGSSIGRSSSCRSRDWRDSSSMTMKDYPPSQTPGSFNLSKIEEQLKQVR